MYKLFFILSFFIVSFSFGQFTNTTTQGAPTTLIRSKGGLSSDSGYIITNTGDTTFGRAVNYYDGTGGKGFGLLGYNGNLYYRYNGAWVKISSGGNIPAQFNPIAGWGILLSGTYPNITFIVDTSGAIISKNYFSNYNSLNAKYSDTSYTGFKPLLTQWKANQLYAPISVVGSVTSIATNNGSGIIGGTIVTTGTITADTTILSTKAQARRLADSAAGSITTPNLQSVTNVGNTTTTNIFGNNLNSNLTVVTATNGVTTLTASSARIQDLTGVSSQTFQLPDATTLTKGFIFEFNNNASGTLSVVDNGSNAIATVVKGAYVYISLTDNTTANGSWDKHFSMPSNASYGTNGMTITGTLSTTGLDTYSSNLGSSYTSRTKVDKNYVDSSNALNVKYADTSSMLWNYNTGVGYGLLKTAKSPFADTSKLIPYTDTLKSLYGIATQSYVRSYAQPTGSYLVAANNLADVTNIATARSNLNVWGKQDSSSYATAYQDGLKIPLSQKNANNGVAPLDAGGKVPVANLPSTLMIYKGLWDATTNSPSLANGSGTSGWVYQISNSGGDTAMRNWFGIVDTFYNNDWVIYNGSTWEISGDGNNVKSVSVNGSAAQQGVVSITLPNSSVTNAMLAGSIAASKLVGTDITTVGTLTSGAIGSGFTAIPNSALANSTISGVSLGSNLNALSNGYGVTTLSYNGSSTGSVIVDSTKLLPRADSNITIGYITPTFLNSKGYGTGSVTSVATGYGLSGGTITTTGTLIADSTALSSKLNVLNQLNKYTGSSNIVTVGTITSGTWNAGAVTSSGSVTGIQFAVNYSSGTIPFYATQGTSLATAYLVNGNGGSAVYASIGSNSSTGLYINTNGYTGNAINVYNGSSTIYKVDYTGAATFASSVTASSFIKSGGTSSQFLKADGSVDGSTYLTGNQTITLSGDVSGSGTTAITTAIGAGKVTNTMLAGSIAASKLVGTDIATVGTITSGVWQGTAIADSYISSASTWNGKQAAYTNLTSIGSLANGTGWLYNNGTGTFSYTSPTKTTVGLGNVENTALSTWAGTSNITTVGTLSSGSIPYSLLSGTVPTWNQNTTGTASNITATTNSTLVTASALTTAAGGAFGSNAYTSTAYLPLAAGSGSPLSNDLFITNAGSHIYGGTTTTYSSIGNSNYGSYILINGATNATPNTISIVTASGNAVTFNADHSTTLTGALSGTSATFGGDVQGQYLTLHYGSLNNWYSNATDEVGINYSGYNNGTTQFRNLTVYNGKNTQLFQIIGSTGAATFSSSVTATSLSLSSTTASTSYTTGTLVVSGGVGIAGAVYANSTMNVAGYLTAAGGAGTSDKRLKDTTVFNFNLSQLDNLHVYQYHWNKQSGLEQERNHYSVFAQEVEKIAPDLVFTANDSMGKKSVNFTELHTLEIERLKQRISEQNDRIERLEKAVFILTHNVHNVAN